MQNAHSYVNAAFFATLNENHSTLNKVALVFGAVSSTFYEATGTENYLKGKEINYNETLQGEGCFRFRDYWCQLSWKLCNNLHLRSFCCLVLNVKSQKEEER